MSSNSERALAKTFREHLAMHVAWVPMTSSVSLGDYGLWRKGLFVPIGNVSEFGVALRRERGKESRLDYSSEAAVSVGAAGTSDCGPIRGELGMRFTKAGGCLVRVGRLTSARIGNLAEVARALARLPEWRRRYKLVTEVFTGEDVLIAVTAERDTELLLAPVKKRRISPTNSADEFRRRRTRREGAPAPRADAPSSRAALSEPGLSSAYASSCGWRSARVTP